MEQACTEPTWLLGSSVRSPRPNVGGGSVEVGGRRVGVGQLELEARGKGGAAAAG
jgi:hypothetical protein